MSVTRQLTPDEIANIRPCAACDGLGYVCAVRPDARVPKSQWQPETVLVTCRRCYGDGVQR